MGEPGGAGQCGAEQVHGVFGAAGGAAAAAAASVNGGVRKVKLSINCCIPFISQEARTNQEYIREHSHIT